MIKKSLALMAALLSRSSRLGPIQRLLLAGGLLACMAPPALAELERTGPIDPKNGYPVWYQDQTGLALEFAGPLNQLELDGGWTLLLTGDTVAPETFPTAFFDEHFYFAANAGPIDFTANGVSSRAALVLALEAAFGSGAAAAGDQIVFGRVRISIPTLPISGDYKIYTPYGVWHFAGLVAGERLFFTDDIGLAPGSFDLALSSRIGPFLLPSDLPGGAEMPALTAQNPTPDTNPDHFGGAFAPTPYPGTGKSYIADPARLGPVTGSPLPPFLSAVDGVERNHNLFRVEGPIDPSTGQPFVLETFNFALVGRIFTGSIPGRVEVKRATYTDNGAGDRRVDVFASGSPTTAGRLPGQTKPAAVMPLLSFYPAPPPADPLTGEVLVPLSAPPGVAAIQMYNVGSHFWGQAPIPATDPIPAAVTIQDHNARDANGQAIAAYLEHKVTDAITISEALYTPTLDGGTLSVRAASTDTASSPLLTLGGFGDLAGGQLIISSLTAPPDKVTVVSSFGGVGQLPVTTGFGQPSGGTVPLAVNDLLTIAEDSGATGIDVTANDSFSDTPTVTIVNPPQLGVATVSGATINYTPALNANGSDSLTYKLTVGGLDSNLGSLGITITPVNDLPTAVNESASTLAGVAKQINVLLNDTDPDGSTDLANAVNVTPITPGATVTGGAGGVVTFTAATAGTYSFSYQAQDKAGGISANTATVTVTVIASEILTITRSEYTSSSRRWRVVGTSTVRAGQTITVSYANGTMRNPQLVNGVLTTSAAGYVVGTAIVDGTGNWTLDFILPSALGIANPSNTGNNTPTGSFWTTPPRNLRETSSLAGATITSALTIR